VRNRKSITGKAQWKKAANKRRHYEGERAKLIRYLTLPANRDDQEVLDAGDLYRHPLSYIKKLFSRQDQSGTQ